MLPRVKHLFFYVSGEHDTLPYAEVKAILQSEGFHYENVEVSPHLLCLEADKGCLQPIVSRSSFTKICGVEIFRCNVELGDILEQSKEPLYCNYVKEGESFSVRIKKTDKKSSVSVNRLERRIGDIILEKTEDVKVKLTYPDKVFFGVITEDHFILGQKFAGISQKDFNLRKPSKRPFFHPSALSPKLARCMVNLARAKPGKILLDPFCGTGSILLEAKSIGCRALGSDVKPEMMRGSLRNLKYFNISQIDLSAADARKLPFHRVDCVSTDPPYSRSSSTLGFSVEELASGFLSNIIDILPRGGCISIALPIDLNVVELGESVGYMCVENHLLWEHKSLTREIAIFKKP
jgi:tRNA (guanine10-N2)-dimethyltransferase